MTLDRGKSGPVDLYNKDWGTGRPVVFSHGWPLTADAWEDQMFFLGARGYPRMSAEEDPARAIFDAATDGTDRLRHVAAEGIKPLVKARRVTSTREYMASMRSQSLPRA